MKRTSVAEPHVPLNKGWETAQSYEHAGKSLTPGTLVSVRGERGAKFKFLSHVRTPDGREWLNLVGGTTGVKMLRAFRPERISRVFRVRAAC